LWHGIEVPAHEPMRDLLVAAVQAGVNVSPLRAGMVLGLGSVRIRVLHPPAPDWERPRVRNDDSVVLEVVHGDVAVLLTGDVGAAVERMLAPRLTPARIRVLKVAHHGSRTSSAAALLESWRPQVALVSAGRGNTFGHPSPEVLRRLESIGARVLRTGRDGQITIESDGARVSVDTFVQ
jgi:competence protein ComEC